MESTVFNMDKVVDLLNEKGIKSSVQMTGGNCATIYCGEENEFGFYPVACGPGSFKYEGLNHSIGFAGEFYIGTDVESDDGFYYDGSNDEVKIAESIATFYADVLRAW